MGFFDKLFSQKNPDRERAREVFRFVEGYSPTFRTFQGEIYESDLIRASLDAHARHAAKLKIEMTGSAKTALRNKLRNAPNTWQT